MAIKLNTNIRNAIVDNITQSLFANYSAQLRLYTGSMPASPDTAPTGTLLVTIDWGNNSTSWNAAANGSAALAVSANGVAVASGTAGYGVLQDSLGNNRFFGSVGTTGTDFIISSVTISNGATITCSQCTISQPAT